MKRSIALLVSILIFGLTIRLFLAPHNGYEFDIATNQGWGRSAVINGISSAYSEQVDGTMIPNYPAFSLMIFGAVAKTYEVLSDDFAPGGFLFKILIKLPAIFADLGSALLIFWLLKSMRDKRAGLIAALWSMLHPAIWFDSAVWGQTDSIFTFFSFLSIVLLARGKYTWGGMLAILSLFTKVQTIMFAPIMLLLALQEPKKTYRAVLGGLGVAIAILLPFIVAGVWDEPLGVFFTSVGFDKSLTVNAYNFWWSQFPDGVGGIKDDQLFENLITYRSLGLIAFGFTYALVLYRLALTLASAKVEKVRLEAVLVATALCSLSFFLFNTEMHERYLFPFVVIGLPLPFLRRDYIVPYIGISIAFCFNLVGVLPFTAVDKFFFRVFPGWDSFMASLSVFLFFTMSYRAWHTSLKPALTLNQVLSKKLPHRVLLWNKGIREWLAQ